jgi:outer membrane protein assembly factor BamD|tara:strand:- start:72 stop:902 length:831 start_codon:yes stop_codon:yes gene_type:complete
MKKFKLIILCIVLVLNFSCAKENIKKSNISKKSIESQMSEAYQEGIKELEKGDVIFAAKKFNEAETLFPQSEWAPKAALMAAYAYYSQNYYKDTIFEVERFIKIYPKHKNIDYAYYLLSLAHYEQIVDEKKDLQSITKAKINFEYLLEKYPNSEYALDVNFKIDMVNDILASKEMYVGRYYFEKKKWIPAINRFKTVLEIYDTTVYIEEALHRLVEVHYILGLEEEAKKYANLLGYNYRSSKWYEKSYSVFDKSYAKKKKKEKNNFVIKKFKSLFE